MTHQEIRLLLPEYVNETLSPTDRVEIQSHLATCENCTQELEQWRAIQSSVIAQNAQIPAPSPSRLASALKAIEMDEQQNAHSLTHQTALLERLANWVEDQWQAVWQPMPTLGWAVIAAQFVLIVGLVGFFSLQEPTYSTLSGPSVAGSEKQVRVVIGFHPSLMEAEIRKTLLEMQGTIVGGPSALGLYTIAFPISPDSTDEIERKLHALKQRPDIFQFVERES